MYTGYSALSVDFLSKPSSINRQPPDNMLNFTDIYSSALNISSSNNMNKAFIHNNAALNISSSNNVNKTYINNNNNNSNNLPELRPGDIENNLAVIDCYRVHSPTVSPQSSSMGSTSSPQSPVNSSDFNSSVNSSQSSSSPSASINQSSSSCSGEESSPPTLRYGSRSIKGPRGETLIKPSQNYIALISMAILCKPQKKMLLNEIYEYFEEKHPYFKHVKNTSWKNSIRHNLSLNECFIKNGRSDNGQGNYWTIHPACIQDFKKGDFRRRQARRRAKRGAFSQVITNQNSSESTGIMTSQQQYPYLQDPLRGVSTGYVPMTSVQATTGIPYNCNSAYPTIPSHSAGSINGLTSLQPPSFYHGNALNNQQAYNNILTSQSSGYCSSLPYNYTNSLNQYGGHNSNLCNTNDTHTRTMAPPNVSVAQLSRMGLLNSSRECMDTSGITGYIKGYL